TTGTSIEKALAGYSMVDCAPSPLNPPYACYCAQQCPGPTLGACHLIFDCSASQPYQTNCRLMLCARLCWTRGTLILRTPSSATLSLLRLESIFPVTRCAA